MLAQTFQSLPATLAAAWHHPFTSGNYTVTAFAVSAGVIGFACCYWAAWMHARLANYRLAAERDRTRAEADIGFRDALLSGSQEAVAVLGSDMKEPLFAGAGRELLQAGMAGKDAVMLAGALDALLKSAMPFEFVVRKPDAGTIAMRGTIVARRAVVFLRDLGMADLAIDYRAALDSLTTPVWIRGRDLALRWGNRAFLAAVNRPSISGAAIERSEPDLAAIARDGANVTNARRYATIEGERRALSLNLARLEDGSIAGNATDITETAQAEARLVLAGDAHADVLEHVPAAIAIFGPDQRLVSHNHAYTQMWSLPEAWLNTHPSKGDILERLREMQSLPEQRDFPAWKRSHLQLFENSIASRVEEVRHLPDGRSIRVTARPYLLGGIVFLFEDLTEQLRIESSFTMLGQVLRATLDTIDDGIAIFWPDGRMVLHNKAFAKLWQLTESELAGEPHLAQVAALSQAKVGQDGIWGIVAAGVTSEEPERCAQWGKTARADGKIVSVSMSRLPNGATVVTFADLTNLRRFEITSEEPAHVAA
jgi:PAS domain-containing protein